MSLWPQSSGESSDAFSATPVGSASPVGSIGPISTCSTDRSTFSVNSHWQPVMEKDSDTEINQSAHFPAESVSSCSENSSFFNSDGTRRLGLRIFLVVAILSAFFVTALEAFLFGLINVHRDSFSDDKRYLEMSIFLALFIFAGIYQIVVVVVALWSENITLLAVLCLFYASMLMYTGIQYKEISSRIHLHLSAPWEAATMVANIAAICVLATTLVVQSGLVYFVLRKHLRWCNFKKTGASVEIKRLYSYFQLHRCLLVFDFFFFVGFTVQFLVIMVSDKHSVEFVLTCCMLPLTIVVLVASDFAATRELVLLSATTVLFFVAGSVYVLFKMVRLFTKYTSAYNVALTPGNYFPGRTSLICFGCVTLVFLMGTIVMEGVAMYGYNRGLLPYVSTYYSWWKKGEAEDTESDLID